MKDWHTNCSHARSEISFISFIVQVKYFGLVRFYRELFGLVTTE